MHSVESEIMYAADEGILPRPLLFQHHVPQRVWFPEP